MNESSWPFDQAPDVACITTIGVLERGLPILNVTHYDDDHSWSFVCGMTDDTQDGRVISMAEALRLDPSLASIADLPPGWRAQRGSIGGEWSRWKSPG